MQHRTYVGASALGALGVLNGHRPVVRRGWASLPVFAAGVLDTEVPRAKALLHAALLVGGIKRGALRRPSGVLAAALDVATIGGALHLQRAGRRAADVLDRALVAELGAGYRDRMASVGQRLPAAAPLERRRLPGSLLGERRRFVTGSGRDVAYGDAGKRNLLDVWRRPDLPDDAAAPVLVQVHGGGWVGGNKHSQALPLLAHLAERGWVCVSTTYRVSPLATWPDLIEDVLRTVAWTKANISRFGGDPGFVAITGGSAGGHLAALAALAAGDPEYQRGFEAADTSVQAAVPLYGVYDMLNRNGTNHEQFLPWWESKVIKQSAVGESRAVFDRASPLARVHAGAPPFFVVHGANDSLVKPGQAREFADELRKVSTAAVVHAELPYAQHGFDFARTPRTRATAHAIERFLGVAYAEHRGG
jgi:acetyl esterase/lipase